eukprot:5186115-Prymnesium_polylepis.2
MHRHPLPPSPAWTCLPPTLTRVHLPPASALTRVHLPPAASFTRVAVPPPPPPPPQIDPEVLEDARLADQTRGGEEEVLVLTNDGSGLQDVRTAHRARPARPKPAPSPAARAKRTRRRRAPNPRRCRPVWCVRAPPSALTRACTYPPVRFPQIPLLTEVLDVIDSSLPLIGRANAAQLVFAPDHQTLALVRSTKHARRALGAIVLKPHRARGFLEIAFCVVRKEEQRSGVGKRLITRLKQHAVEHLRILHLLTYADDSATTFFEKLGFDDPLRADDPHNGMPINRFHWGISHYIGSQLRQCVLDPDGHTLYAHTYRRRVPQLGRRLPDPREHADDAPALAS